MNSDLAGTAFFKDAVLRGYKVRASDVHFESIEEDAKARLLFRVDGEVKFTETYDFAIHDRMVSWLRTFTGAPGKFLIHAQLKPGGGLGLSDDIELRIALFSLASGEFYVVVRFMAEGLPIPLDKIGLSESAIADLMVPCGGVMFTGSVGSGRLTTAVSYFNAVLEEGRGWCIDHDRWALMNIPRAAGTLLAKSEEELLAAGDMLDMADMDAVYLGELDCHVKVELFQRYALQGFITVAHLHSGSASHAIWSWLEDHPQSTRGRLLDALSVVSHQLLIRRLCAACKRSRPMPVREFRARLTWGRGGEIALLKQFPQLNDENGSVEIWDAPGCEHCRKGYKGRLAIHELVRIRAVVRDELLHAKSLAEVANILERSISHSRTASACKHLLDGQTSLEEVERI